MTIPVEILLKVTDKASGAFKNLGGELNVLNKGMSGFKNMSNAVGGAVFSLGGAIAGLGLGALAWDITTAGADLERMNATMKVLAKNTGTSDEQIQQFKDSLAEVNTHGRHATATINTFLQSGLAGTVDFEKFIGVTKDFAASMGVSSGQAIQDFTKALTTLRPELLETYGIQFNLGTLYKNYSAELGKTSAELTEVEKRQALLNEVFKQGEKVAGVYKETYSTAGKNLLSIKDTIQNLKDEIGMALQPAFEKFTNMLLKKLQEAVKWFEENRAKVEEFGNKLAQVAEIGVNVLGRALDFLINHQDLVIAFFTTIGVALGAYVIAMVLANWQTYLAIAAFTLLVYAIMKIYQALQPVIEGIIYFVTTLIENVTFMVTNISEIIQTNWTALMDWITNLWQGMVDSITTKWNTLSTNIQTIGQTTTEKTKGFFSTLNTNLQFIFNQIQKNGSSAFENLKTFTSNKTNQLVSLVQTAFNRLTAFFSEMVATFRNWGSNIGGAFLDGFKAKINQIKDAAINAFNQAKAVLKGNSPPVAGPLKNIDQWGYNVGTAWVEGMKNAISDFQIQADSIGQQLTQGYSQASGTPQTNATINLTVNVGMYAGNPSEKRQIAQEILEALNQTAQSRNMTVSELITRV